MSLQVQIFHVAITTANKRVTDVLGKLSNRRQLQIANDIILNMTIVLKNVEF